MELTLSVQKDTKNGQAGFYVSYPEDHPLANDIDRLLDIVGPGYAEYWLQNKKAPTCFSCQLKTCKYAGSDRDACKIYKIGPEW